MFQKVSGKRLFPEMDVASEKDDAKFWLEQLEDQITIPEIQDTK